MTHHLGVDATNLRSGGAITHLHELLEAADLGAAGFAKVTVWGGRALAATLPVRSWLTFLATPEASSWRTRVLWQSTRLHIEARARGCDVLFVPGGIALTRFRPVVAMCRNMLPFDPTERRRYRGDLRELRLLALRLAHEHSFMRADGLIFLCDYAEAQVQAALPNLRVRKTTIPHGVSESFLKVGRSRCYRTNFTDGPCRIVYVSPIQPYKHHDAVVGAALELHRNGWPIELMLVGAAADSTSVLWHQIRDAVARGLKIVLPCFVPHSELPDHLGKADLAVFASSCENFPNTLLEKMATGLPIASTRSRPMTDLLDGAGHYFNPGNTFEMAAALTRLLESSSERIRCGRVAAHRAAQYSWSKCASQTLSFLSQFAPH
jgi:glycosyltransferase involved in cell wall biosynthesis